MGAPGFQDSSYQTSLLPAEEYWRHEMFGGQQLDLQHSFSCRSPSSVDIRLPAARQATGSSVARLLLTGRKRSLSPPCPKCAVASSAISETWGRGYVFLRRPLAKTSHLLQENVLQCGDNPHQGAADSHEKILPGQEKELTEPSKPLTGV